MDNLSLKAVNLHTMACLLIDRIEDENFQLMEILNQLESGEHEPLLYCSLKQIFMETQCEIMSITESIDSMLGIPDLDEGFVEALQSIRIELLTLRSSTSELEERFTPYLFCPALQDPEHSN